MRPPRKHRMGVKLFERLHKALLRHKEHQCQKGYIKLAPDTSFYVDAGYYFIERSGTLHNNNSSSAAPTSAVLARKTRRRSIDYLSDISRPRRNAIFELSEEEREGLTMVLKGYIQQRNLKEFGML